MQVHVGIDASNIRAGGGLTNLIELLAAAEPPEHQIDRVTVWAGSKTIERLPVRPWLNAVAVPALGRSLPRRGYWQRFELARLAARQCDVLLIPGGTYFGEFRPFVAMSQNLLPFELDELRRYGFSAILLKGLLLRMSQSRTFARADAVVFLTRYAQEMVTRTVRPRGIQTIIPHGIATRFLMEPRPQRPIDAYTLEQPFRLLYVSIVDVYKHQWHVVEAVAQLRRAGLPLRLDLVGPAYEPALRRLNQVLARVDPGRTFVRYHGPVPYDQLHELYHCADTFVYASSCENMPIILLEAMAAGLPIVCARRGPMPEVLGQAGVYCDPEQPRNIGDALVRLIAAPQLRAHVAEQAFATAQRFSWSVSAQNIFALLSEVAQKSPRRVSHA